MPNRRAAAMYLIAAMLMLQLSCARRGTTPQPPPAPTPLKVLCLPFLGYAPFLIAQEEGHFAEQGLEVEFIKMANSTGALAPLATGELDVWAGTVSAGALNVIGRGANIRIVADKGYFPADGCAYLAVIGRTDLVDAGELTTADGLRGRRVATIPSAYMSYFTDTFLRTHDLTVDDVAIVPMILPAMPAALKQKEIDICLSAEPLLGQLLRSGAGKVLATDRDLMPNSQFSFLMYGPSLLEKNPDAGRRFMRAYLKAVRQLNEGKTEHNVASLAKHLELPREVIEAACWPLIRDNLSVELEGVLDFQTWASARGVLDNPAKVDILWDPSFAEDAVKELGREGLNK